MAIQFHQIDVKYSLKNKRRLKTWVQDSILTEKRSMGPINIILCSDEYLIRMNEEYLKHNYYTDIITFDYTIESTVSGDLFISIDRVKDNAIKNSVSTENEIQRVIIHGVMHLCGYKDKKSDEIKTMRSKEEKYLKRLTTISK
ncbi:MAG: rRNA maturation RNase YbeY [Flavobacteriales bacterium]|nr:rRNA maturation RNase YbeY [Flavobacteriales bacterium]